MKTFAIFLLTVMLAIDVKKSDEKYLLIEIDHEEAIGMIFLSCYVGVQNCMKLRNFPNFVLFMIQQ